MYVLCNDGAMAVATVPDVCKTPAPLGPIPVPYPNMGDTKMADPGGLVNKVLVCNMPALNLKSKISMSNGDQAGSIGGVTSNKIMGEVTFITGSQKVMFGGKPVVRLTSQTTHNGSPQNTIGIVSVPGQTKVMALV